MSEATYQFDANTFEEVITAAGIVEDDGKVYMTGKRFREMLPMMIGLKEDIEHGHRLCTEMGIPDLGGGSQGLVKRLEFLKNRKGNI
jgi:hypothetical protein